MVKGKIKVTPWYSIPTTPYQCSYQYFLHLTRYSPGKIFKVKALRQGQGQIKVTPWHHTPTLSNQCPHQISPSYALWFLRYSKDKIFKFKVTTARSKVNQGHTMMLHTYTFIKFQYTYQVPTSHTLWFLRYSPNKLFLSPARLPAHPDTMGENNTCTALKGCVVKKKRLRHIFIIAIIVMGSEQCLYLFLLH